MKSFKEYISEATMTYADASKLFGIGSSFTQEELKKKWKELQLKYHPDRGGSDEMSKNVNAAYDILKKGGASGVRSSFDMAEYNRKQEEENAKVKVVKDFIENDLKQRFKAKAYVEYFQKQIGKDFTFKFEDASVDVTKYGIRGYIKHRYTFTSTEGDVIFYMSLYVYPGTALRSGGLTSSSSKTEYECQVDTDAMFGTKKVKMGSRTWKNSTSGALDKPEDYFPSAKLKKAVGGGAKKSVFKKADMISFFKLKLGGSIEKDWYEMPIGKNKTHYLLFSRLAKVGYSINGIYGYKASRRLGQLPGFYTLPETEGTALFLKELQKKLEKIDVDNDNVDKYFPIIDKETKAFMKEYMES